MNEDAAIALLLDLAQIEGKRKLWIDAGLADLHSSRCVTDGEESGQTAALRLEGVYRECRIAAPAGVHDMILTAAETAPHPAVHNVKGKRRVHANRRVEGRWRLPRAVAHSSHKLSDSSNSL